MLDLETKFAKGIVQAVIEDEISKALKDFKLLVVNSSRQWNILDPIESHEKFFKIIYEYYKEEYNSIEELKQTWSKRDMEEFLSIPYENFKIIDERYL
ncbi:hypothetical protein U732_89 [Clostridium argentinense CDC 2741]|uniref:Uncharacterized protein n=2 Tax=Clostridium argentinense TaxID=29341 RepID=A0A0C1R354_9CLOT|nr:hypothetical protein [Clostridium argentinense]ARC83173.1 hypothetical protein RSJ17_00560 [Clostridium argentinense]KIE44896.1 hypothetical protein U732_89 [Clostridium argentinense CDC 2741]NFF41418.1 hypothetical protein [Clostridium argentinense]NFP52082.1 hypothetical protein [Clostridium argentinense]NFP74422.1 hypothetical protein [Clostridium argentinense]